jgi:hypothetical protein
MADQKISELVAATSSLSTDELVIRRGFDNFSLQVGLVSSTGSAPIDTGSFVKTSSISGTTQTFTKGDGSTYTNEIVSASFAVSASYAVSSSVEITKEITSSYADTASYFNTDPISASLTTTDQTISASVATLSGSASTARNQIAADYIAADTTLSASLTTTDQTISASVATLSGSASTARDAIASDLDAQSSSFASDRVMRTGDTMTGNLTIQNSGPKLILNDNAGTAVAIIEFQDEGTRTGYVGDFSGPNNDIGLAAQNTNGSVVLAPSGTGVVRVETVNTSNPVRITNVQNPTGSQDAATKNYADNLVYSVPVMFSGNGSGSSGDYAAGAKLAFSVDIDTNSAWSDDTYTVPEDGVYEIITSLRTRIETSDRRSAIYKDTGHIRIIENPKGATDGAYRSRTGVGHIIASFVTGDEISVRAFQTTTNYPNISENGLSIRKLRN